MGVILQSGKSHSFEATFDANNLNVGLSIYDDSGLTPVLVHGPAAMDNVVGNMYRAKFTPSAGKSYLVYKAVYTDDTLTTLDSAYLSGSESFRCEDFLGSGIQLKKNTARAGFVFALFRNDGILRTGAAVTAKRCIDGGSVEDCDNAVVEISNGLYSIDFSAADLNGGFICFLFTATNCAPTTFTVVTQ